MPAGDHDVDGGLAGAEPGCTELLDRVHDEERLVGTAQIRERLQIDREAVRPLHRAHDDCASLVVDVLGEGFDWERSAAIPHDPQLPDCAASCQLRPGDRDLEELEVADHDVLVRREGDRRGDHVQAVGRALDECDLGGVGVEQSCPLAYCSRSCLVQGDVVDRGVTFRTHQRPLEEALDRPLRVDRSEPDARGVEERLAL